MSNESSSSEEVIRDFIYVDLDRLYSVYSQVFEGVVETIVKSIAAEEGEIRYKSLATEEGQEPSSEKASEAIFTSRRVEDVRASQLAEASLRTESKVLYDHMYNILEARLRSSILVPEAVGRQNFEAIFRRMPLVRVTGHVRMEDYPDFSKFLGKWNEFADAVAGGHIEQMRDQIEAAKNTIKSVKNRDEKARLKKWLERYNNPRKVAEKLGLTKDEKTLDNLKLVADVFKHNAFDIILTRPIDKDGVAFRAILEREGLRKDPTMLRGLYGGSVVSSDWHIIGFITFVPQPEELSVAEEQPKEETEETDVLDRGIRGSFSHMFERFDDLEKTFIQSAESLEMHISPIVIYREIALGSVAE